MGTCGWVGMCCCGLRTPGAYLYCGTPLTWAVLVAAPAPEGRGPIAWDAARKKEDGHSGSMNWSNPLSACLTARFVTHPCAGMGSFGGPGRWDARHRRLVDGVQIAWWHWAYSGNLQWKRGIKNNEINIMVYSLSVPGGKGGRDTYAVGGHPEWPNEDWGGAVRADWWDSTQHDSEPINHTKEGNVNQWGITEPVLNDHFMIHVKWNFFANFIEIVKFFSCSVDT